MRILSIETSCDETAMALVSATGGKNKPTFKIEAEFVASQVKTHRPFGGVVPNLAKREHLKNLPILYKKISSRLSSDKKLDAIAVTVGPGLEPALWAGINFAQELHKKLSKKYPKIKLIGVNHLHGHLYSFLLPNEDIKTEILNYKSFLPAIHLLVSGGHTMIVNMKDLFDIKVLGETVDDAAGEAFDKVARMLGLPYPGGPEISRLAKEGNANSIDLPRPMLKNKSLNLSFSGLKTAVLYYIRDNVKRLTKNKKADIAASFEEATVDVLAQKTLRAVRLSNAKSIILSGGVAANARLRERLAQVAKEANIEFKVAKAKYNTDNAVMIAVAGYINSLRDKNYPMEANGGMSVKIT